MVISWEASTRMSLLVFIRLPNQGPLQTIQAIKSMRQIPNPQLPPPSPQHPSPQTYLLQIQGQCQISSLQALKFNWVKTVPVVIFSVLTIIPCIILVNFKKVRKCLFYSCCDFGAADHLYVEMEDGNYELVAILQGETGEPIFTFKQLRYKLSGSQHIPMVLDYNQYLQSVNTQQIIKNGLKESDRSRHQKIYGPNIHEIEIQNYFQYMFSVIFQPLYILQYIVVCSLAIQGLPLFGIILVVASLITTSGNYVSMYVGKLKIRKMAEKSVRLRVVRDAQEVMIESVDLVPGDIVIFDGQSDIPCDCVVMQGEMFVNECSLTGENIPIKKTAYRGNSKNVQNWLYDGTKVLQAKSVKVMVIMTGFATKKGRLLRKILNRVPTQPDFFNRMFFFLIQSFVIGMALYGATLPIRLHAQIDMAIVVLRVLDYLVSSVPPAFPIYFTIAYSWSLYRMKNKQIFSTMPQKTVESNRLKTACFDKTGTLTLNNLNFKQFYLASKNGINPLNLQIKSTEVNLVKLFFGTCHSVRKINGQDQGDEVDLKLWTSSGYKLSGNKVDTFENQNGQTYKILVLNQFESRFQSMSVLVKQQKSGKHYVIVKGAPEKIYSVCLNKPANYPNFISEMSFRGLRTIAFGYKMVTEAEVGLYISKGRQQFLDKIQLVGVAAFENALKPETVETIKSLHEAQITTCMITGDNIFIAVEIGYQSGILNPNEPIVLVEGKKFETKNNKKIYNVLEVHKKSETTEKIQRKCSFSDLENNGWLLAVDNDFVSCSQFRISDKMRIFARILPDKKALIVQNIKQEFQNQYNQAKWYTRFFGEGRHKVSMTGDGANDLMAIKEADVGIGINGTDAVYSSAFTITNLANIIDIVKQGKCTTLNILQCLRFTLIANYINLVVQILLATQATFISQTQGLYINFLMIILVPIVMSLAEPPEKLSPNKVKDNFLCWQNQLAVWVTLLILAGGLVGSYFFVTTQPGFVFNPKPQWRVNVGYNFECQLVTLVFLGQGLILATLGWIVSQSLPFKNYFYTSKILTIVSLLNFIAFSVYFFIIYPSGLSFLNFLPIPASTTGVQYAILMSSIIVATIFNLLLHKFTNRPSQQIPMQNSLLILTTTNTTSFQIQLFRKNEMGPHQVEIENL